MQTSMKLVLLGAAAAVSLAAAPVYAGKQSTPGATGATTTLSALLSAPDSAPALSGGGVSAGTVVASSTVPGAFKLLSGTSGSFPTTLNGASAVGYDTVDSNGNPIRLVAQGDTVVVLAR